MNCHDVPQRSAFPVRFKVEDTYVTHLSSCERSADWRCLADQRSARFCDDVEDSCSKGGDKGRALIALYLQNARLAICTRGPKTRLVSTHSAASALLTFRCVSDNLRVAGSENIANAGGRRGANECCTELQALLERFWVIGGSSLAYADGSIPGLTMRSSATSAWSILPLGRSVWSTIQVRL